MNTPNIGLELLATNSLQPSVAINDALQVLDALVQLTVIAVGTNSPPATVEADIGKRWIVGTAPVGAWAGSAGAVALCTAAGLWRLIPAREGFETRVVGSAAKYRYDGATWVAA